MIAIKGMKTPNSCIGCGIRSGVFCYYKKTPFELNEINMLDERPSDCPLVEIVTCKDCKYNNEGSCDFDGWGVADNYFCAKGARKE